MMNFIGLVVPFPEYAQPRTKVNFLADPTVQQEAQLYVARQTQSGIVPIYLLFTFCYYIISQGRLVNICLLEGESFKTTALLKTKD